MSEKEITPQEIKSLLRRGDPAEDTAGWSPEDRAHLRRRVLEEAARPRQTWRIPAPALAAATLMLLVMFLWMALWAPPSSERAVRSSALSEDHQLRDPGTGRPAGGGPPAFPSAVPTEAATQSSKPLRLNLVTPGGTRVVWALDPDFDV